MNPTQEERATIGRIAEVIREGVLQKAAREGRIIRIEPGSKAAEPVPANTRASSRGRAGDELVTGPATVAVFTSRFVTTAEAARELSTNEHALREKIRRAACRVGGRYVADLGVIAFHKFGRSWRGRWAV